MVRREKNLDAQDARRREKWNARLELAYSAGLMTYEERERCKQDPYSGGPMHARALYDRSVEACIIHYPRVKHPPFDVYMRGLLRTEHLRKLFAPIAYLYPPKPLPGLEPGYSYWRPTNWRPHG